MSNPKNSLTSIPISLLEQLERGNVLLFVGQGVNQGQADEAGLPSLAELATELAQRCDYPVDAPLTWPHVAYFFERRQGYHALITFLRERLWNHRLTPLRTHRLICKLPVPIIVTTTYDDMLERAHTEAAIPIVPVVRDEDVAYTDRQKRLLVWLLGRLDQPESLLLTETQLATFLSERRGLSDVLRAELAQRTWLIVGFYLSQAWIRTFYASVIRQLDRHNRTAYFYGQEPNEVIAEWCQEHNIKILRPDITSFLVDLTRLLTKDIRVDVPEIEEDYPEQPYKGLASFDASDRRIFFGRERETQRLTDLVRAYRLVLLYGSSGTGKTSRVCPTVLRILRGAQGNHHHEGI